jgi:hypothetical protein
MIIKYFFPLTQSLGIPTPIQIPTFSEILDVFSENNTGCVLVKERDDPKPLKDVYILIELSTNMNNTYSVQDRFKYYGTIKSNYINNNNYVSSQSNQINIETNSHIDETVYFIFIDENIQLSEERAMKLEKIDKDYE